MPRPGRPPVKKRGVDAAGYVKVWRAPGVWEYESRLVMERELRRPLRALERVRHRNGDPSDNRPENLRLEVRRDRRVNPWVECECGCGNLRRMYKSDGRRGRFIAGHNARAAQRWRRAREGAA